MAAQALNFTKSGSSYTSDEINGTAAGKVVLHLNFTGKRSTVNIERTIDKTDGFAVVESLDISECVYEKTFEGIVTGVIMRVVSTENPTTAKYLAI